MHLPFRLTGGPDYDGQIDPPIERAIERGEEEAENTAVQLEALLTRACRAESADQFEVAECATEWVVPQHSDDSGYVRLAAFGVSCIPRGATGDADSMALEICEALERWIWRVRQEVGR